MDRQGFLSSMPFLLPCPSAAWPPRRSTGTAKFTRVETLLQVSQDSSYKFKLCLEPALTKYTDGQHKLEEIQPAFFGKPLEEESERKSSFDPSLSDIEVAVESSANTPNDSQDDSSVLKGRVLFVGNNQNNHNNNANNDSASTQTTSSHKITPNQMQMSFQRLPNAWPLFLYFRIDNEGVFQVDGKQILHLELIYPETKEGEEKPKMPPSLLLVFGCCTLRIFPLYCPSPTKPATDSDTPKKSWMDQALEALQELEKHLRQLSSNNASTAAWSPCGSSLPSSAAEAGQKDGGYPTPGGQGHSHSHSTLASSSNSSGAPNKKLKANATTEEEDDTKLQENHIIRKAKRRRDALARSRAGMKSVETILDMPMSVCKPDPVKPPRHVHQNLDTQAAIPLTDSAGSGANMFKTQGYLGLKHSKPQRPDMNMAPLLTGITEDLTASYGTHAETQDVLELYQLEIEEQRCNRMDQLLDSFFPHMPQRQSKSSSRKHRRSSSKSRRGSAENDGETGAAVGTKSAEEVMKSVERLVLKQKALVEERCSFLELPTRG